ncbi:hypothetical protein G4B88_017314 [Cannabis sativa]|uniref:RNase H type-1 domain-containing protein n=1 Tax=Cannabis sativa TaxID=3483 RepID=A0A7J6DJE3_CANSA|nr:hypothetical protein G4B88_017314 [Cannabis sativa]
MIRLKLFIITTHLKILKKVLKTVSLQLLLSNQLQKIGIGASVFDSKGDIVATMSSPCDGVLPPLLAEAKALLWALRWCIAVEFPLDRIETDSQLLVRKVRHRWKDKSPLFDLVNQIKACPSFFPYAAVSYVPRNHNAVSHSLAKAAFRH